jgi:hypothetical protein
MKRFLPSGLMIFAGILGIATATAQPDQDVTKIRKKFDLREAILRRFFKDNRAPVEPYAGVFLRESDRYQLDWRLLPSLSMIESGGGKYARNNNLFGWANGQWAFPSISEAVHHVALTLSNGKAYRGKDLEAKLWTYNHRSEYKNAVMGIMQKIYPTPNVESSD